MQRIKHLYFKLHSFLHNSKIDGEIRIICHQVVYDVGGGRLVTIKEAYEIIRAYNEKPLTFLANADKSIYGPGNDFVVVDKKTGTVKEVEFNANFLVELLGAKELFYKKLYVDYLDYYKMNGSECKLAELYATAWYRLNYTKNSDVKSYRHESDKEKILSEWVKIERVLYNDIRERMAKGNYYTPPCVLNKGDDPFYQIKPFMLSNGWTDNDTNKTWVPANNKLLNC